MGEREKPVPGDWWRLLDGDEEDGLERRVEALLEADEERWERWVDKL